MVVSFCIIVCVGRGHADAGIGRGPLTGVVSGAPEAPDRWCQESSSSSGGARRSRCGGAAGGGASAAMAAPRPEMRRVSGGGVRPPRRGQFGAACSADGSCRGRRAAASPSWWGHALLPGRDAALRAELEAAGSRPFSYAKARQDGDDRAVHERAGGGHGRRRGAARLGAPGPRLVCGGARSQLGL